MRRRSNKNEGIVVGHRTDPGRKRSNNEDSEIVLLPPDVPPQVDTILAVADGMGGHQAGEVASRLAVRTISDRLGKRRASSDTGVGNSGYPSTLREVVEEANRLIVSKSQGDRQGMGTTLTLGLIEGGRLHLAHVGDSRAYLLRNGEIRRLTQDHSWVGEEVRAGRLRPEEAESHPRRNLLTRALGADADVDVDTETVSLREGDLVLLCSDGLHGVVSDEEITNTLRDGADPQKVCDRLVRLTNERGGPDNVTVVLARIGQIAGRSEATTMPMATAGRRQQSSRRISARVIVGAVLASVVIIGALGWLVSRF